MQSACRQLCRQGIPRFVFHTYLHTVPADDDKQMQKSVQVHKGITLEELLRCACIERRGAGRSRSASVRPVTRAMLFFLFMSMSSTMSPTTLLYVQAKALAPNKLQAKLLHVFQMTWTCGKHGVLCKYALKKSAIRNSREQNFEAGEQTQASIQVPVQGPNASLYKCGPPRRGGGGAARRL